MTAAAGFVNRAAVRNMTARGLARAIRQSGPVELVDALELELHNRRAGAGNLNRERASLYALAEYYAWSARRSSVPAGNDPRTGRPWQPWRQLDRAIGRAQHAAAARVAYAAARSFPSPLELLEQHRGQR